MVGKYLTERERAGKKDVMEMKKDNERMKKEMKRCVNEKEG